MHEYWTPYRIARYKLYSGRRMFLEKDGDLTLLEAAVSGFREEPQRVNTLLDKLKSQEISGIRLRKG